MALRSEESSSLISRYCIEGGQNHPARTSSHSILICDLLYLNQSVKSGVTLIISFGYAMLEL